MSPGRIFGDTVPLATMAPRRTGMASCTGPCRQGRQPCPCPTACEGADDADRRDDLDPARGIVISVALVLACLLAAWALASWWPALLVTP